MSYDFSCLTLASQRFLAEVLLNKAFWKVVPPRHDDPPTAPRGVPGGELAVLLL